MSVSIFADIFKAITISCVICGIMLLIGSFFITTDKFSKIIRIIGICLFIISSIPLIIRFATLHVETITYSSKIEQIEFSTLRDDRAKLICKNNNNEYIKIPVNTNSKLDLIKGTFDIIITEEYTISVFGIETPQITYIFKPTT